MKHSNSFRNRIFLAIVVTSAIFVSLMAYINYRQNAKAFRQSKLNQIERVNSRVQETYRYILNSSTDTADYDQLKYAFTQRVFELSNVHKTNINIYDLDGNLLGSNRLQTDFLPSKIRSELSKNFEYAQDSLIKDTGKTVFSKYSYLTKNGKNLAILNTQNIVSNTSLNLQLMEAFKYYIFAIIFLVLISGIVAWILSRGLTAKIHNVSEKFEATDVRILDQPIDYQQNDEIQPLVNAYNNMLGKLKYQTQIIQKSEREEAWKEMAKQVAHEINNPLTPLRLTIQNFHRRYDPEAPDNKEKVRALTESVVHQIDMISSITKSFSDFAKMPSNQDEEIDIVETIKRTLDIFPPTIVSFTSNVDYLNYQMDSLYLTRIVTNIVKNGIQATQDFIDKEIKVQLIDHQDDFVIQITDNGSGISDEHRDQIFEQDFTTKITGMGLGLSMVKKIVEDYKGQIWFEIKEGVGTTFYVKFNK